MSLRGRRITKAYLAEQILALRIDVSDGHAARRAVLFQQVDDALARERRHDEGRDLPERLLDVEGRGEQLARLRHEAQHPLAALPLGDVDRDPAHADHLTVRPAHRVVAPEPHAPLGPRARQVPLELDVRLGLACLEHPAQVPDRVRAQRRNSLVRPSAEVLLDADRVQHGERLVHPHVAQVRVQEEKADRRGPEQRVEEEERILRGAERVLRLAV